MKPLLAVCALAALVLAILALRMSSKGLEPVLSALASDVQARTSDEADLVPAQRTEAAPVAARAEAPTKESATDPTGVGNGVTAPARTTATLTVRVVDDYGAGVDRAWVKVQPIPLGVIELQADDKSGYQMGLRSRRSERVEIARARYRHSRRTR